MKITTDHTTAVQPTGTGAQSRKDAGAFDALLREAARESAAASGKAAQGPAAAADVMAVAGPMFLNLDTSKIVGDAERLVSSLEELQSKLSDARIPLEELSPLVEKMDREKELLMPTLEMLPSSDPLRSVLNTVLVACTVETEKFRRGDYL